MPSRFWSLLTYKLPAKVDLARIQKLGTVPPCSCSLTPTQDPQDELLDKIIDNQYCRPLTLDDLSYYCNEVEHTGENLQFHLDMARYERQWQALSDAEQKVSPPVSSATAHRPRLLKSPDKNDAHASDKKPDVFISVYEQPASDAFSFVSSVNSIAHETDLASIDTIHYRCHSVNSDDGFSPAKTDASADFASSPSGKRIEDLIKSEVGIDWTPSLKLPLRAEVERIVQTYLLPSSPHQLNLGYAVSLRCITALGHTSHPSAFKPVANHVRHLLLTGTLPNFLRYSANNANTPRKWSTLIGAVVTLAIVFVLTLLNIVQKKPVAMRAIGIPSLWFGITSLLASLRGSCFLLFLRHRVQARPYEPLSSGEAANLPLNEPSQEISEREEAGESWVSRWRRKSLWRKLFHVTHTTSGPYRDIQDAIALQSVVGGLVITIFISILVALIPVRN